MVVAVGGAIYIGPDSTTVLNPNGVGRESVKIVSKQSFTHGLFIVSVNNMPGGVCGVEPKREYQVFYKD